MRSSLTNNLHRFILIYLSLSITLLTLNPLVLNELRFSPEWVLQFSFMDFARNILLFLPFGIVLQHWRKQRLVTVWLYGLLLSGLVESGQLFIDWRTSNLIDLIANSGGALLGAWLYQSVFSLSALASAKSRDKTSPLEISLACMFVPLSWVSTMRSLWETPAIITAFLSAIASLSLIQSALTQSTSPGPKSVIALLWLSLFWVPVVDTAPKISIALGIIAPFLMVFTAQLKTTGLKTTVLATAIASLMLIICVNGLWLFTQYLSESSNPWSNNEHLRVSELLLSALTTFVSFVWYRTYTHQKTKQQF